MSDRSAAEELDEQVTRLRERAATTTDPAVTAKAIAVSDDEVREALEARLANGETLESVRTLSVREDGTVRVYFPFSAGDRQVNMTDEGVLATVDPNEEAVVSVESDHERAGEEGTRPFALSVPSRADEVTTQPPDGFGPQPRPGVGDELGIDLSKLGQVIKRTPTGTTSFSGSPEQPDDTKTDYARDADV